MEKKVAGGCFFSYSGDFMMPVHAYFLNIWIQHHLHAENHRWSQFALKKGLVNWVCEINKIFISSACIMQNIAGIILTGLFFLISAKEWFCFNKVKNYIEGKYLSFICQNQL